MCIKMLVDPTTGEILGAQGVGTEGIDKRIDVLATAIRAGLMAPELADLELAYAPPFGSANDPVNVAGFVAGHIARGDVATVAPETWQPNGEFLLDVRDADDLEEFGRLAGAVNVPLAELRDRIGELPRDGRIVAYCQKGQRGYLATCLLRGRGFEKTANLRGGYLQAKLNGL